MSAPYSVVDIDFGDRLDHEIAEYVEGVPLQIPTQGTPIVWTDSMIHGYPRYIVQRSTPGVVDILLKWHKLATERTDMPVNVAEVTAYVALLLVDPVREEFVISDNCLNGGLPAGNPELKGDQLFQTTDQASSLGVSDSEKKKVIPLMALYSLRAILRPELTLTEDSKKRFRAAVEMFYGKLDRSMTTTMTDTFWKTLQNGRHEGQRYFNTVMRAVLVTKEETQDSRIRAILQYGCGLHATFHGLGVVSRLMSVARYYHVKPACVMTLLHTPQTKETLDAIKNFFVTHLSAGGGGQTSKYYAYCRIFDGNNHIELANGNCMIVLSALTYMMFPHMTEPVWDSAMFSKQQDTNSIETGIRLATIPQIFLARRGIKYQYPGFTGLNAAAIRDIQNRPLGGKSFREYMQDLHQSQGPSTSGTSTNYVNMLTGHISGQP